MKKITDEWDGQGLPEKKYRVRWKTTDNSKRSGWLPNDYPSFKNIKNEILDKKILIETENVETGERFCSDEYEVSKINALKYLRLMSSEGYAETAALGIDFDDNVFWVFHNNKIKEEAKQ